MKNLILTIACAIATFTAFAKTNATIDIYVQKYRFTAQMESFRSGIPTSIILAQAILESEYGNSDLCERSNNHFGVKWWSNSDGDFVLSKDDDYDAAGNLIPSKFIKYSSVEASFKHHTNILVQRKHYRPLFKFDRNDYEKWANGLYECGYSTDKTYGSMLIGLIKRLHLNDYDLPNLVTMKKTKADRLAIPVCNQMAFGPFIFLKTTGDLLEESLEAGVSNQPIIKAAKKTARSFTYLIQTADLRKTVAATGDLSRSSFVMN